MKENNLYLEFVSNVQLCRIKLNSLLPFLLPRESSAKKVVIAVRFVEDASTRTAKIVPVA
jgi:hypothetical protein